MTTARQLRTLLARPGIIRSLAPHDVFTAKVMEQAGLPLLFLGGFGASASSYGLPDLGLLGLAEMADAARRMTGAVSVPVIVDGDTGYGSVPNVIRTVREFERAGAAGLLLEDQVFPKRCGHFAGKQVVPVEEMETKLKAALDARRDSDFVVIARTDARAVEGLDSAIDRANRYAELGADLIFVEAPQTAAELARIAREIERPQLANMLVGGATPILSADELERLGFKIVVSPVESLTITAFAVQQLSRAMLDEGRVDGLTNQMCSFSDIKQLLGVDEWVEQQR
ncbi:MAG: isocitrate lyase/PEP mutase family protein [Candidatus Saccharimonas sp.]|nr:isocitrate lyase/PEP mutase family protein [Planctomycetaceae bacterium]